MNLSVMSGMIGSNSLGTNNSYPSLTNIIVMFFGKFYFNRMSKICKKVLVISPSPAHLNSESNGNSPSSH